MPVKTIDIEGLGTVRIYKRRGLKNIRLGVNAKGEIRISLPSWLAQHQAIHFLNQQRAWLDEQLLSKRRLFQSGQRIGKSYTLHITSGQGSIITSLVRNNRVTVTMPATMTAADSVVQTTIEKAAIRALRQEAAKLLPQRLALLASQNSFKYRGVSVKHLKRRWGSCSSEGRITLNLYLMQLPWRLIDYVLLHELTHTQHLNHGKDFWQRLEECLPGARAIAKEVKAQQPVLGHASYV